MAYAAFACNRHFIVIKTHKGRAKARGCSKLHPSITLMRNSDMLYVFCWYSAFFRGIRKIRIEFIFNKKDSYDI